MQASKPRPLFSPEKDDPCLGLAAALFAVVRQVKHVRSPGTDPVDGGALIALAQIREHGPIRLSDVAGHCGLDLSTISRHVRALEDRNLLARATDPADRRAQLLEVTDAGQGALVEILRNRAEAVRTATHDWSEEDLTTLTNLLTRLATDLARPTEDA